MPEPTRFRRRPLDVEAVQWTDTNANHLEAFAGQRFATIDPEDRTDDPEATAALRESAHESWALLYPGDWVVKAGDRYAVLPRGEFEELYEPEPFPAANVPGSTAEQLPDDVLALLVPRTYLSTACETARRLAAAIIRHPERTDLPQWRDRLHTRCRLSHEFTGQLCICPCHWEESDHA